MKKIFVIFALLTAVLPARAAQIVNVDYIVKYVKQKWNVDVPHNATQVRHAANMEYLLNVIDWVNGQNGNETNYGTGEYATRVAVDTTATIQAVDTLIKPGYHFYFTPETDDAAFSFTISAAGKFIIDWGDGETQVINKTNTIKGTYSHTYTDGKGASEHKISLGGKATAYSTYSDVATISFTEIKSMDGCLGCVFPSLGDGEGNQPRFYRTFYNNTGLTGEIPKNLFSGIRGAPVSYMFSYTFYGCRELTGSIPDGLFGELSGRAADHMFESTFSGCSGLTGSIPDGLFGNFSGLAATHMFASTFYNCSGLTGKIPDGLFGNFTGTAASYMFSSTFSGCSKLESIGEKIFGNFTGSAANNMFYGTFSGCSGLTGKIPDGLFGNFTANAAYGMFRATFSGCSGLTGKIPDGLFGNFTRNVSDYMFASTFYNCSGLTGEIPDGLFGNFTGNAAQSMFSGTFYGCSGLTGKIPDGLFGNFTGNAAGSMFSTTFYGCSGLTGKIPDGLFGDFTGDAASGMFYQTFYGCSGLTGKIPDGLFGNFTGDAAGRMFSYTFYGCSGLESIGENIFGNFTGSGADSMFYYTFYGCSSLTGPSATIGTGENKQFLYERWPRVTVGTYGNNFYTYGNATGLSDYNCIPTNWGGPGKQAPGTCAISNCPEETDGSKPGACRDDDETEIEDDGPEL